MSDNSENNKEDNDNNNETKMKLLENSIIEKEENNKAKPKFHYQNKEFNHKAKNLTLPEGFPENPIYNLKDNIDKILDKENSSLNNQNHNSLNLNNNNINNDSLKELTDVNNKSQNNNILNDINDIDNEQNNNNQILSNGFFNPKNQYLNDNNNIQRTCLINNGESSYLNSVLQCLANIKNLEIYFLEENNTNYINNNIKNVPISFVTSRLFRHIFVKKDEKYSLESFLRVILSLEEKENNKDIKKRNANECLIFILNHLHTELNRLKNGKKKTNFNKFDEKEVINYGFINFKNSDDSIISDTFSWLGIDEIICNKCKQKIFDFSKNIVLKLNIFEFYEKTQRNNFTILNSIEFELKRSKNDVCEKCKQSVEMKKITQIYTSPKILVFLIDRRKKEEYFQFNIEEVINLNKFCYNKDKKNISSKKYQLIGIVSINIEDKKYVSFCSTFENKKWYYFKDEKVMIKKESEVIYENNNNKIFSPCILFYQSLDGIK